MANDKVALLLICYLTFTGKKKSLVDLQKTSYRQFFLSFTYEKNIICFKILVINNGCPSSIGPDHTLWEYLRFVCNEEKGYTLFYNVLVTA